MGEGNFFGWLWNEVGAGIGDLGEAALSVLPDSPFTFFASTEIGEYLGYVNYFIPVSFIVSVLEAWLVSVGIFYLTSMLLRWVKAIE